MANLSSWRCLHKKLLKTGEEKIPNLAERGEPGGSHRDTDTPPPLPPTTNYISILVDTFKTISILVDTFKTKQKRLRSQKNRSLFVLEYLLC